MKLNWNIFYIDIKHITILKKDELRIHNIIGHYIPSVRFIDLELDQPHGCLKISDCKPLQCEFNYKNFK